jgi:hypothetical protein
MSWLCLLSKISGIYAINFALGVHLYRSGLRIHLIASYVSRSVVYIVTRYHRYIIPDSLFNGTAPKLRYLELRGPSIRWKSPLLQVLQTLKTLTPSAQEMPTLGDWLAASNEMSQRKPLILLNATPAISVDDPLISEPQRTATLPSLTHFDIAASPTGCALTLHSHISCCEYLGEVGGVECHLTPSMERMSDTYPCQIRNVFVAIATAWVSVGKREMGASALRRYSSSWVTCSNTLISQYKGGLGPWASAGELVSIKTINACVGTMPP